MADESKHSGNLDSWATESSTSLLAPVGDDSRGGGGGRAQAAPQGDSAGLGGAGAAPSGTSAGNDGGDGRAVSPSVAGMELEHGGGSVTGSDGFHGGGHERAGSGDGAAHGDGDGDGDGGGSSYLAEYSPQRMGAGDSSMLQSTMGMSSAVASSASDLHGASGVSYLELGRKVVEEKRARVRVVGRLPRPGSGAALPMEALSAEMGAVPVGDVGVGTVIFGSGPESPVGGMSVLQLHERIRGMMKKKKPKPDNRPSWNSDITVPEEPPRQRSVNYSGVDDVADVPKPGLAAVKAAARRKAAKLDVDSERNMERAIRKREKRMAEAQEKRRKALAKIEEVRARSPLRNPEKLEREREQLAATLKEKQQRADEVRAQEMARRKAAREQLVSRERALRKKLDAAMRERSAGDDEGNVDAGVATELGFEVGGGVDAHEDHKDEEGAANEESGGDTGATGSAEGEVLFEYDGRSKEPSQATGVPPKRRASFESTDSKARRRRRHAKAGSVASSGTRRSGSAPSVGSARNSLAAYQAPVQFSPPKSAPKTSRSTTSSVQSSSITPQILLQGRLRRLQYEHRKGGIFSDIGLAHSTSAPAAVLSGRWKTEEEMRANAGDFGAPGPGAYKVPYSFVEEQRKQSRGVPFPKKPPTKEQLLAVSRQDRSPGPGRDAPVYGMAYVNKKEMKGFSLSGRQATPREIAKRCGWPTGPAPGGTYRVPSFVEDNLRQRRGKTFVDSRKPSKLDKLVQLAQTKGIDRSILPGGPGSDGPLQGFAEEAAKANKGPPLGIRPKTPRTILRDIGEPQSPAPGGTLGYEPPSFTKEALREFRGPTMLGKGKDESPDAKRKRLGFPTLPGPGEYDSPIPPFAQELPPPPANPLAKPKLKPRMSLLQKDMLRAKREVEARLATEEAARAAEEQADKEAAVTLLEEEAKEARSSPQPAS